MADRPKEVKDKPRLLLQPSRRRNQPQSNARDVKPPTVESPTRDQILYSGRNRGSKPVNRTWSHNMEFAGFIPLVRETYDTMAMENQKFSRNLPYAIFQHAMTELLVAYQLHQAMYELQIPHIQTAMNPLTAIEADTCSIPVPIFEYICGIGPNVTPEGVKIYWNLPAAAIPMGVTTHNNQTVRPGSFGPITAENHNVYECYVSPFITSEYVIRTAAYPANSRLFKWNPLPAGWFPSNGEPNDNLLGYRDLHNLHPDAIQKCNKCDFDQSEEITGLLCHSPYAMSLTSTVLDSLSSIKVTKAEFRVKDNSAAFIFKESQNTTNAGAILWDEPATLKSPFAFSATASNRAHCCAYKRRRAKVTPGTCYLVAGEPPEGWISTRNSNFEITAPFGLQRNFRDRESLRSNEHQEEEGFGTVSLDIFNCLEKFLIVKK